jgi:hypothetical protein
VNGTHADGTGPPVPTFDWQRTLHQHKLRAAVHHVGLTLSTYANRDGTRAHPSVARLVQDTGLSKRTVLRALEELRSRRLVVRTFRRQQSGRRGLADEYRLTLPERVPPEHPVTAREHESATPERVPRTTRTGATDDTNGCHLSTPTTYVPTRDHPRHSMPGADADAGRDEHDDPCRFCDRRANTCEHCRYLALHPVSRSAPATGEPPTREDPP